MQRRTVLHDLAALCLFGAAQAQADDPAKQEPAKSEPAGGKDQGYTVETLNGKVDWLAAAMKRRHGVQYDADAEKTAVALETQDGRIFPIVKDLRGRGFFQDARIRDVPVELYVRRFTTAGVVQVIRMYTFKSGRRYAFDYWCDVCAIPMYELKECECCQGEIRIRERLAPEGRDPLPE